MTTKTMKTSASTGSTDKPLVKYRRVLEEAAVLHNSNITTEMFNLAVYGPSGLLVQIFPDETERSQFLRSEHCVELRKYRTELAIIADTIY